ncbi:Gfo/Idh/MocA family protein [Paractinoplanes brasiliensis]|uniref:Putative dehydrogenase n=1 Tax=Paractinoplanes brasiliensis TaxID=52695 RepID=A0A4R6JD82_9ACTN|nr:Gfo/Idh/MocA family oxidoreductase [Actinoplanes brasiliensis]TDO32495.1 putative dehydrogenase [Actinoplanes brasiliensis]GID27629.1 dehydrogenase [Actinoplanes brasiliensis]
MTAAPRVVVVGLGDVSVVHLAAIEKLRATLAGVCDSRGDHRALLDEVRPDVVHICTPHDQHVPIALDALERGVHVLLEKPVAHTIEQADLLVAAAKDHPGLKVGVCLQNRYNLTSQAAHEILTSGELGRVIGASASVLWHRDAAYYAARPWRGIRERSGGGVLINQAIHTLDLLQWLAGEVTTVRGHAGRYGGVSGDVEDTAHLILDHAGGARSVFFATTTNAVDSPVTVEIVAEHGTLLIRGDLTVTYADGRVETIAELAPEGGGRAYWGASHELLIADFYGSLDDPEPFWIGPQEALRSQHLIDRIYHLHP